MFCICISKSQQKMIYILFHIYFILGLLLCILHFKVFIIQGAPSQSGQCKYWITLIIFNIFRKVFFSLLSLPFYNLFQLIFENNIDKVAAVIGETKSSSFFGIFHHIGQRLGRYLCHIASNVVFELFYGLWLIGINLTLQKSTQKEVWWSQIRGSWWAVNIPGRVVLKKAILTGH